MPPKTIGIPGTLFLYPDRVRIVTRDGTEVEHPRRPVVGNTSYRNEDGSYVVPRNASSQRWVVAINNAALSFAAIGLSVSATSF